MAECFLRKTEVVLADGRAYSFRALPFSRRTVPILRALMDDGIGDAEKLEAVLSAVEISLSYDYAPEEVSEILDMGLVSPTNTAVLNALVAGMA